GGSGAFADSGTTGSQQFFWDNTNKRLGIGTVSPQSVLDLGAGTNGRSIVWGGATGTAWYSTIGTNYSSGALSLMHGLKLGTSADEYQYSFDTMAREGIRLYGGDISFFNAASSTQTVGAVFDWATNTKVTIKADGKVGIGASSPVTALHVVGTGSGTSVANTGTTDSPMNMRISRGTTAIDMGTLNNSTSYLQNRNTGDLSINYNFAINPNGGNVGIGTISPKTNLDLGAAGASMTAGTDGSYIGFNAYYNGGWKYKMNGYASFLRQDTSGMQIWSAPNNASGADAAMTPVVGLTISPTGVLTGNGSGLTTLNASNLSSGTVATARLGSGTANSTTFLRGDNTWQTPPSGADNLGNHTATTTLNLANNMINNTGQIFYGPWHATYDVWLAGSNTAAPARNLALLGTDNDSGDTLYVNYNSEYASGTVIGAAVSIPSTLTVSGAASLNGGVLDSAGRARLDANGAWIRTYGNSGWYNGDYGGGWYMIDTTYIRNYNSKQVYLDANITAPAFLYSSDLRLKENIKPLEGALAKLSAINGVTFTFKAGEDKREHLGVIAQEVEAVYPQAVITDEKGFKKVDYPALVPVLIEAVKELKVQNDELRARLDKLEAAQ
ncbi:MAG TPA: tail fiber domain-containing protein, partial [Alphaproteobacteria bacterium]